MKKFGLIFSVVACGLVVVPNAYAYRPYFSVGGGYYDSRVNISRGNASVSSNGLSLTATAGVQMNQYLGIEVNGLVNQLRIQGDQTQSDITFVSIMPGARLGVWLGSWLYPYVGASVGPSFATNEYSTPTASTTNTTTTLAYQGRAGLVFNIGGGAGLDVGVRYQSQGKLNIDGGDFVVDGTVTSFNYYITASYGF